ncbi:MAG: hypothetical protein LBJ87_14930 [bacterium]|nr:hypothetical protein [bacterium]
MHRAIQEVRRDLVAAEQRLVQLQRAADRRSDTTVAAQLDTCIAILLEAQGGLQLVADTIVAQLDEEAS